MTRRLSHRITAISMALLMLLSSTGFSIDLHYCQDQIKGISLIGKAKSCHDKQATPTCHNTKKTCHHTKENLSQAEKNNCCHNETVIIEKADLDAAATQMANVRDIQLELVAAFVAVYVFNIDVQAGFQPFVQYKPPLPDRDIQVLYQTFLI